LIFREVEDRDLIAKARTGDVEGYNLLVSRWEKRVFNYLLRLVSNREDAMDLSQDVFLKLSNLPKLDDPPASRPGCSASLNNEAFSLLRKRKPEGELTLRNRARPHPAPHCCLELSLAVEPRSAVSMKTSASGPPQGLPGIQIREMAEILGIAGLHRQIAPVHCARLLKTTLAPMILRGEA